MYSLTKYNEIDLQFIYNSTVNRIIFLKLKRDVIKPKLRLVVLFRNVIEPDFTKVYLHVLMLWIMTGKLAKVFKIDQSLRRGTRYYRFVLKLSLLDNFRFFRFIEFIIYSLFDYIGTRNYYYTNGNVNDLYFMVKNINGFTNLRFSDNFYLSGMPNDLLINFVNLGGQSTVSPFLFLSMLKLI